MSTSTSSHEKPVSIASSGRLLNPANVGFISSELDKSCRRDVGNKVPDLSLIQIVDLIRRAADGLKEYAGAEERVGELLHDCISLLDDPEREFDNLLVSSVSSY